ncbi:MAG: CPBP family intramembrane metalloprotease [Lachnospiraceae bacterium]|nr:CPBP family intramembrane metalloprotease [Lachnospiraceae bacterium]
MSEDLIREDNVPEDNASEIINDKEALEKKRLTVYLVLVFGITYIYEYFFVIRFLTIHKDYTIASIPLNLVIAMFLPSICVVLTRLVTKEGFKDIYISFNMKEGRYRYYLLTWFVPPLLTLIGTIIYFLCLKGEYSADMEYIIATYTKQGVQGLTPDIMKKTIISQGITSVLIGPVVNCLTCFGEEWGWRGYLLPKLSKRLKTMPLMIVMGLIWGLWHLPLIIAGHNYGTEYAGYPFVGIIAMVVFCFSIGTLLSYATLKTGSCIPAVIGHGAINGFASIGIYFTKDGGRLTLGPSPAGFIAGIPCLVFAIILIRLMMRDEEIQK